METSAPSCFLPSRLLAGQLSRTATLTTFARRPALTAGATLATALTALPLRTLRANLFRRQLAVAILVKRLQRGGGIGDFLLVDHAIMVRIQRGHQRPTHHALSAALTTLAGTALTATLARRTSTAGALRLILSQGERGGNAERERGQQDCL